MPIYYSANVKGFYDTDTLKYNTLPEDIVEITIDQRNNYLREMNANNKMLVLENGELVLKNNPITWDIIRGMRDGFLKSSDYTQLPDFPAAKKEEWATYRQALRDIPQIYATPEEVIWPTEPT